ncbi:hypothetical protein ACFE04_025167 [Oxalis oulophora]
MGCVTSKQPVSVTPATLDYSFRYTTTKGNNSGRNNVATNNNNNNNNSSSNIIRKIRAKKNSRSDFGVVNPNDQVDNINNGSGSGRATTNCDNGAGESISFRLRNFTKYGEGQHDHVAAGWPAWLNAVAGEAIKGWVPLRPDAFQKLEKIGQGTYSNVFRARELETGKIVALKKVRFDSFEPESVRFMAREILILRRLHHPNVMTLKGIITSRLSSSIYLVFEYMEHDITGLISCPDVKFTDQQIKCYIKQLLEGLEHCHSRGVLHRDIKGSNLLVNNEGILKVADFGLANFVSSRHKHPLTSRVVTLWYRPPELLLGATDYGATVDLWSVGCVLAELLLGKPILQGRTEVEQLHKIFKLCGSPPDDYWKKSKLPHSTLFKPQQHYDSCLRDTFKDFPVSAVNLIDTLLSVEPYKRGTASSALASEYFMTEPYACEPSSLPIYPPSKEIDAKHREEAKRKKTGSRPRVPDVRKQLRKSHTISKLAPLEDGVIYNQVAKNVHIARDIETKLSGSMPKSLNDKLEDALHIRNASQGDVPLSGPLQISTSSGFAWAKRRNDDGAIKSHHSRSLSRGQVCDNIDSKVSNRYEGRIDSRGRDSYESSSRSLQKQWRQFERPGSFDASDGYYSQDISLQRAGAARSNLAFQDGDKVDHSGPMLSQSQRLDELLEKHERQMRQAIRKSWFQQRGRRK